MSVGIITAGNLGRGFALGTATSGKVEVDLGAGLAFSGNQVTPVAKRCLFVRRTSVQALGAGVDLLFDSVAVVQGLAYDAATGVVTAPAAPGGVWRVSWRYCHLTPSLTKKLAQFGACRCLSRSKPGRII